MEWKEISCLLESQVPNFQFSLALGWGGGTGFSSLINKSATFCIQTIAVLGLLAK